MFELVLSMIEAVPAILIMSLALRLMSRSERRGCITLGRKLGSIGLVLELGPVAKAGRQIATRYWPVEKHDLANGADSHPANDIHLSSSTTKTTSESSGSDDSTLTDPASGDSDSTQPIVREPMVVALAKSGSSGISILDSNSSKPAVSHSESAEPVLPDSVLVAEGESSLGADVDPQSHRATAGVSGNTSNGLATESSVGSDSDSMKIPSPKPGK